MASDASRQFSKSASGHDARPSAPADGHALAQQSPANSGETNGVVCVVAGALVDAGGAQLAG